jgi:hypothetical protein
MMNSTDLVGSHAATGPARVAASSTALAVKYRWIRMI